MAYAGIHWGDTVVRDGHFPVPRPFVPGFEASGHIAAVGEGVDASRVGEPVTALTTAGACAEVVLAPAVLTWGIGAMPLRTAASLGWGRTDRLALVAARA